MPKRHRQARLLKHMIERQVEPQIWAEEMRERGHQVDVELVNTRPDAEGFEIACLDCGRTARLPFEVPEGKKALCPDCIRARRS